MPVTIKVNGVANSLVHKGSNGISTATIPDVCKTPSPGGPVPVPYPNVSQSATLDKGTTTVKADGGMMIAIKGSEFSLSNGDNAGVAGGVKSSTFMKESTWILYSFDVKMDGKNACRLSDKKFHNHENAANLSGEMQGPETVEDCGGPHSKTKTPPNDGKESHHTPAKDTYKHTNLDKNDGPAIKMDPADHQKTASWGTSADAKAYRQKQKDLIDQGKFDEAIEMDVKDIKSKFPGKYDACLDQMLAYAKTIKKSALKPAA
jgi:hypothetical protein